MIERALITDLDDLLALMRAFYAAEDIRFDLGRATAALRELLITPELGAVWILRDKGRIVGYLALCFGFSLEFGGRDAFIDEVVVAEPFRNQGWGAKLIETALQAARDVPVMAVHLSVRNTNANALRLYRRLGFEPHAATLLTRRP